MSQTLATAALTAAAAFAASGLASSLALWGVRKQLSTQRELAAQERADRRAAEDRIARRDEYAQLISTAIQCASLIRHAKELGIADDVYAERVSTARAALSEVIKVQAIISVEGPRNVIEAASQTRWSLASELEIVSAHRRGIASADEVNEAGRARRRAVGVMAAAARQAFGIEPEPSTAAPCVSG
ncbi:hypothetical protein ACGFZJ_33425 [Streptomyces sp. NPDC048253]|uniref:hypothetical protein n=1 Tax=Streptomyces sp. NPDC048253 TaxID=3365524 RepID=UPI003718ED73